MREGPEKGAREGEEEMRRISFVGWSRHGRHFWVGAMRPAYTVLVKGTVDRADGILGRK